MRNTLSGSILCLELLACGPKAPKLPAPGELVTSEAASATVSSDRPSDRPSVPEPPLSVSTLGQPPAMDGLWPSWSNGEAAVLAWTEEAAEGQARLVAARLREGQWELPFTIAAGRDWFVNWADFPQLCPLGDGGWLATWLQRSGPDTYDYAVALAHSSDGGTSWREAGWLHSDQSAAEHGFVSLLPQPSGEAAAFWLDGRGSHAVAEGEPAGAMRLYTAVVDTHARVRGEQLLDERVCDCCGTDAVCLQDGSLVVVYRDRSEKEVRDIAVVRGRAGEAESWSRPALVHEDAWLIPGCPVNGPRIASRPGELGVLWFTMLGGLEPRVFLARSSDGGRSFGPPLRVDVGEALGRGDLAYLPDGRLLLCWLRSEGGSAQWCARLLGPGDSLSEPVVLAPAEGSRASGFLRLHAGNGKVLAAFRGPGPRGLRVLELRAR